MDCRLANSTKSILCFTKLITTLWLYKRMFLGNKNSERFRSRDAMSTVSSTMGDDSERENSHCNLCIDAQMGETTIHRITSGITEKESSPVVGSGEGHMPIYCLLSNFSLKLFQNKYYKKLGWVAGQTGGRGEKQPASAAPEVSLETEGAQGGRRW